MVDVGIKALKNDLSRYVREAAAGRPVRVTDRGRVVAELVPPRARANEKPDAEQEWDAMIAEGIVRPATRRLTGPPPRAGKLVPFEDLMRDLEESRGDR